jgi:hypothetical protein
MRSSLKRVARVTAVTAVAAAGVLIPAAGAGAAPAPLSVPSLPALSLPAALPPHSAFSFPATGFVPAPGFHGPQLAKGPTVVGSVFNGGTSVVVSNDPPIGSGNVIGSP